MTASILCFEKTSSICERTPRSNGGAMALLKIVEGDDLMAAREKDFGADTADVACGAGDQNVQGRDLSFEAK
jgi:hypothetical protein